MPDFWDNFTSSEKEKFQKICRRLLKQTFIVREKDEESRQAYYFVSNKTEAFSDYFGYIGFDVIVDRDNGVVMLRSYNNISVNRMALKKVESVVLCALWTLYADRIKSGSLKRALIVSITDIRQELEKYGLKNAIDKTMMAQTLNLFQRYNLIDVQGKIGEPNCLVRLYPSLQFALNNDEFTSFSETASKNMTTISAAEANADETEGEIENADDE